MQDIIRAASFLIGLFAFVLFFYTFWQTLCVDWARQRMFEERNNLLRMALRGDLQFDSLAYRAIRQRIERHIRYLHMMTWPRLLLAEVLRRNFYDHQYQIHRKNFYSAMESIDPRVRTEAWMIVLRTGFASLVCLAGRSVILGPIFLVLYGVGFLRSTLDIPSTRSIYSTVNRNAECFDEVRGAHAHQKA